MEKGSLFPGSWESTGHYLGELGRKFIAVGIKGDLPKSENKV